MGVVRGCSAARRWGSAGGDPLAGWPAAAGPACGGRRATRPGGRGAPARYRRREVAQRVGCGALPGFVDEVSATGNRSGCQVAGFGAQPGRVVIAERSAREGRLAARVVGGGCRAQGRHCGLVLARGCQHAARGAGPGPGPARVADRGGGGASVRCGLPRLGRPSAPRVRPQSRLGRPWAWRGSRVIGVWSLALIRWLSEYAKLSKWLRGGGGTRGGAGGLPGCSAARRWGSAGWASRRDRRVGVAWRRGWWVAARRATTAGSSSPVAASTRRGGQGLDPGLPGSQVAAEVGHP